MDDITSVEINGVTYYVSPDDLDYIYLVGNALINTKSSTITLYGSFREYNVNSSGYPRITIQSFGKAYITNSYNSGSSTLNVTSYNVVHRHIGFSPLIMVLIFSVLVMMFFKRR